MNATKLIDDYIAKIPDWRGPMIARVRKLIRDADPQVVEEWKWMGNPVWSHDGIIALAKAFKGKVKVTFPDGANLPDPDKVFNTELEGNKWRALDIYEGDKINERSLKTLVRAAVAFRQTKKKPASTPRAKPSGPKKRSSRK
jgi:hypothetical protein